MHSRARRFVRATLAALVLTASSVGAQTTPAAPAAPPIYTKNDLDPQILQLPQSEMRGVIERYRADRDDLMRSHPVDSPARAALMRDFNADWLQTLRSLDFDAMSQTGRIDYLLLKNTIDHELRRLDVRQKERAETAPLVPFEQTVLDLEEARSRMERVDGAKAAATLNDLTKRIGEARKMVEGGHKAPKHIANRAADAVGGLRRTLKTWYDFYNGYDPLFTWWAADPYKQADQALYGYETVLREKLVGIKPDDKTTIIGNPIGRDALMSDLAHEMIPYTPEELIDIANREFARCEAEMKKASREMGCGDDWHKALERVKQDYVEPGKQPDLIRDLALEAIKFVDDHDLVTVPPLARESWRMEMMSPERQLVSPFFLGGENIIVSYPTNTMTHEQKMMSMRGNNVHFARATVFHELIPGHHLQLYMEERYHSYRGLFYTPFWVEGGALYWEMLFWDLGFPKTPEDRVGMLFWRMHRCARIIFSLSFHLGKMTPQECIDFLVNRVGHERDNATAEVRRSFNGSYDPLYQCAYMLGGLQLRALRRELVDSGKMTDRQFHDAMLKENAIPIELIRADLTGQPVTRDFKSTWRFYDSAKDRR